jgi:hypothetical protein
VTALQWQTNVTAPFYLGAPCSAGIPSSAAVRERSSGQLTFPAVVHIP